MTEKAKQNSFALRPHFKTHQSQIVGSWFKQFGIDKITVSSFSMAEYFAEDGWKDITVAFPVNTREIDSINNLAEEIELNLVVENTESVDFLSKNLKYNTGFFIKIDIGYHRTGVSFDIFLTIDKILEKASHSDKLHFKGFLSHAGHTYKAKSREEILKIQDDTVYKLSLLKKQYIEKYPNLIISSGDTPSSSISNNFSGIDELRPGNFIFYDLTQYNLGSCDFSQVAVAMACPIVAKHADRQEIVIYGGGVHFSKDSIEIEGKQVFGLVVQLTEKGWAKTPENNYLIKVSQEHGTIKATQELFDNSKVGEIMAVIPVHSCMTADLMKEYLSTDGELIDHLSGRK